MMFKYKIPVYSIYLWTFISIGRPQDFMIFLQRIPLGDIAAALSIGSYLLIRQRKQNIMEFPEVRLLFYYFAFITLTLPFAFYITWSLTFYVSHILKLPIYLFFAIKIINTEKHVQGMIKTLIMSGLFIAAAGIIRMKTGVRVSGEYVYDANDIALLMVTTLPILVMQAMATQRLLWKAVWLGGGLICLIVLIATYSRGGFIGILAVFLFAIFTRVPRGAKKWLLMVLALLAVFFVSKLDPEYKERVKGITDDITDIMAGSGRILVWKRMLVVWKDNPILGTGPNGAFIAYGHYIMEEKFKTEVAAAEAGRIWRGAHNTWLEVLVEYGAIGFLIFMGIIMRSFLNLERVKSLPFLNNTIIKRMGAQAAGLQMALVGFLVAAFFLSQTYNTLPYLVCVLSGVMVRNASGSAVSKSEAKSARLQNDHNEYFALPVKESVFTGNRLRDIRSISRFFR